MNIEPIATEAATETRADIVLPGREFRDAVKLLANKAADKRTTMPILSSIYFEIAPDGRATLTATDLTAWASLSLQGLADDVPAMPGSFALECRNLHKVLSKAGKADRVRLTVSPDGERVRLKAGRMEMQLPVICDEFPLAPIRAYRSDMAGELSRAQFFADMAALAPAMSTESHREYLCGIALQVRDMAGRDRFVMAATDGYKMAAASRPIPAGLEGMADCILPSRAVALALAADKVAARGDDLILARSSGHIEITFGNVTVLAQRINDQFPDWPRAIEGMAAPIDAEQGALFPDLLPEWPASHVAEMQGAAPGRIEWQAASGGIIGHCATDPGMVWATMYRACASTQTRSYDSGLSVSVAGDREYRIPTNGAKVGLTKEQVAALCGDDLWNVLEFPGADGKPRYVSQWLWDDGASRLLCVGKDGRCPKAGAVREYVTRAQVEAALAGDVAAPVMIEAPAPIAAEPITVASEAVSAPEAVQECAEPLPAPTDSAEAPASNPEPVSCQPVSDGDPIAAVRTRLAEIEALLATLSADTERPKRTPAHERAIRRAWAARKARRDAALVATFWESTYRDEHAAKLRAQAHATDCFNSYMIGKEKRRRAVLKARDLQTRLYAEHRLVDRANDRRRLAEQEAAEALAMREEMRALLDATEARLAAAEAENAQLWAEIEGLTAPAPALAA